MKCCECDTNDATVMRYTQFAGDHPFCISCAIKEKNFDKIGKMTNNINAPYTEDSFNYTFNDKRKCYLFFKNVDEDFYMYIKASD